VGRWHRIVTCAFALAILGACSSDHDATDFGRRGSSTTTAPPATSAATSVPASSGVTTTAAVPGSVTSTTAAATTTTATAPADAAGVLRGTAVAGSAGGVEPGGPPYAQTDPFAEAVRLADGTCVGWADSRGGSTAGLAVGAPVAVLDPTTNGLLGTGTVTASRWQDVSGTGQWTCFFDFTATVPAAPADVLVRIGDLQPWTARPDPANSAVRVASVSTDAAIGQIASCPALPTPTTTAAPGAPTVATTTLPPTTTVPGPPASGWNAIGQYWSIGVDSLCKAGLPVTALARPCRQATEGSEYITKVVDTNDPSVSYGNGAAIPAGTQLTVAVATGRPCG
jgi:hypothetical protein